MAPPGRVCRYWRIWHNWMAMRHTRRGSRGGAGQGERLIQHLLEAVTLDELHDDVVHVALDEVVPHAGNARVGEVHEGAGLLVELLLDELAGILVGEVAEHLLEREAATVGELEVTSLVDRPHAPRLDGTDDLIATEEDITFLKCHGVEMFTRGQAGPCRIAHDSRGDVELHDLRQPGLRVDAHHVEARRIVTDEGDEAGIRAGDGLAIFSDPRRR